MIVHVLEWAAWAISAILGVWMVYDLLKTGRTYDEEFLTTSVEGTDELFESHASAGGAR
jgi:putative Mn2+ efflux pump MntP